MSMCVRLVVLLGVALAACRAQDDFLYGTFPAGFQWGAATAAYQIEGAWNLSGRGESIWDHMVHSDPSGIVNGDTGDVAADSYNKFALDIAALKETGVHHYRFSLSWPRLLPTGRTDVINPEGVAYYNQLIDDVIANGIKPLVTLFHWDLPQTLQEEFGGFLGEEFIEIFAAYADFAYAQFGDRVTSWITFNEPWVICELGYGTGVYAPRIEDSGRADYICGHNLLKAHARAWHIYDDVYRPLQNGECGITLNSDWFEPLTDVSIDLMAADRAQQFMLGWFAHPIYSLDGDYPRVMKDYVYQHSAEEGFPESRLPVLDAAWITYIKGTSDFFGLNHYSTSLAAHQDSGSGPNYFNDQNVETSVDPDWPPCVADWINVVPWGFRKLLVWISRQYGNPNVLVTENGFADRGELNDTGRIDYYTSYINEAMKAVVLDGCNVYGYTAWSIVDNFEWIRGYTEKLGLYHVDFNDPARPRTRKESARVFAQIIADNGFPAPERHR